MKEHLSILPPHFKGKEAVEHVVEHQVEGLLDTAESHGTETPGHISAAADAARETAMVLILLWLLLSHLSMPLEKMLLWLAIFGFGWLVWKMGRSAWLGWSRLERLHRVVAEERWEIEHHRQQERSELAALYAAKGFHGQLLEDVIDVLMSDSDRLLRVMLEEELGLSLESQEHPLKQSFGAGIGTFCALAVCGLLILLMPSFGLLIGSLLVMGASGAITAYYEKNQMIPAVIWNASIGILAYSCAYFLFELVQG